MHSEIIPIKDIRHKIEQAHSLFSQYGQSVLSQNAFTGLLDHYAKAIHTAHEAMKETGVIHACSSCAVREPGGCCAREVEDWYDEMLLFINLLMGLSLPSSRSTPNSCIFVGSRGCTLLGRHSFCVNFLCPSILDALNPDHAQKLLSTSGEELFSGWTLELALRKWFKSNGHAPQFGA